MTDEGTLQGGPSDGVLDLTDIPDEHVRANAGIRPSSNALRRAAIQVLAANRDAVDDASQIFPVLPDSSLQSEKLVGEGSVAGRGPEAQQKRGPRLDGGRDGGDGITGGTALLLAGQLQNAPATATGGERAEGRGCGLPPWYRVGRWSNHWCP